jgi:hypothetical protein
VADLRHGLAAIFINGNGVARRLHPLRFTHLRCCLDRRVEAVQPAKNPIFFGLLAIALR